MNEPEEFLKATPRDHLANERTFLAYIRTALAFIGFGFVIARFAIFFREFQEVSHSTAAAPTNSLLIGTIMVFIGIALAVYGLVRYAVERAALLRGTSRAMTVFDGTIIVIILCVFGLIVGFIFIASRSS